MEAYIPTVPPLHAGLGSTPNCSLANVLCFMFICNGQVFQYGGPKPPACDVMGDSPRGWSDARLHCRNLGGTIRNGLRRQAHLFDTIDGTGELWSANFIRDGRMMQDTRTTPVPANLSFSTWDFNRPIVASDDQCVSFTTGENCSSVMLGRGEKAPEAKCQKEYQYQLKPCLRKLNFVCQIPALRLDKLRPHKSGRGRFTVGENSDLVLFFSTNSLDGLGIETVCRIERNNAKPFSPSTPANYEVLKLVAQNAQNYSVPLGLTQRDLKTGLFWVKDTDRSACFALSLRGRTQEFTLSLQTPCKNRLRVLCAYDSALPGLKRPQMEVASTNSLVHQRDHEMIAPSHILLEALGSGSAGSGRGMTRTSGSTPEDIDALRMGCRADLTSSIIASRSTQDFQDNVRTLSQNPSKAGHPSQSCRQRATIYRDNEPIANFSGNDDGLQRETVHYIATQKNVNKTRPKDMMDFIGSYHCDVNDLESGAVLSSEPLFVRASDIEMYSVHFGLRDSEVKLRKLFTLTSLLDAWKGQPQLLPESLSPAADQRDVIQKLTFQLDKAFYFTLGFKIKPLAFINQTLVAYAYRNVSGSESQLFFDEPVGKSSEKRRFARSARDPLTARGGVLVKSSGLSLQLKQRGKDDDQAQQTAGVASERQSAEDTQAVQKAKKTCVKLENTANEILKELGANPRGFPLTSAVVKSLDWCWQEERVDDQSGQVYVLPDWPASGTWTSPQLCSSDGRPAVTVKCMGNKREGFSWGPSKMNPNCTEIDLSFTDYSNVEINGTSVTSTNAASSGLTTTAVLEDGLSPTVDVGSGAIEETSGDGSSVRTDSIPKSTRPVPIGEESFSSETGEATRVSSENVSFTFGPKERTMRTAVTGKPEIEISTKSPIADRLEDLSQLLDIGSANATEVITRTNTLLHNTAPESVTKTNVTHTAEILEKVTSRPNTLPASSVKAVLDTATVVSQLLADTLVASQSLGHSINRILKAIDRLGSALQLESGETHKRIVSGGFGLEVWEMTNQTTESDLVIGVKTLAGDDSNALDFEEMVTQFAGNDTVYTDSEAAIYLSKQLVQSYTKRKDSPSVRLAMNVYKDTRLYQSYSSGGGQGVSSINNKIRTINSRVIAAQLLVGGQEIRDLNGFSVVTVFKPVESVPPAQQSACAFWDFSANDGLGDWSTAGCRYNRTVEGRDICRCDHLTNFAVLVSFSEQRDLEHREVLGSITIVGMALSITGLILSIIFSLRVRKLQRSSPQSKMVQQTIFQLSIALLLFWVVFLAGIDRTSDYGSCVAVAALLHYLILASFMWMLVDGGLKYLLFVKYMVRPISHFLWKTALPSWGLPAIPVIIVLAVDTDLYRGGEHYCWMDLQAFYYGFALPVGLIGFPNLVFFVLICVGMWRRRDMSEHSTQKANQTTVNIRASILCFFTMGMTWIFGFLAFGDTRLVFQYLFCITSSLQGFVIFLVIATGTKKSRQYCVHAICCCLSGWIKGDSSSASTAARSDPKKAKARIIPRILSKKYIATAKKAKISLTTTTTSFTDGSDKVGDTRKISGEEYSRV